MFICIASGIHMYYICIAYCLLYCIRNPLARGEYELIHLHEMIGTPVICPEAPGSWKNNSPFSWLPATTFLVDGFFRRNFQVSSILRTIYGLTPFNFSFRVLKYFPILIRHIDNNVFEQCHQILGKNHQLLWKWIPFHFLKHWFSNSQRNTQFCLFQLTNFCHLFHFWKK